MFSSLILMNWPWNPVFEECTELSEYSLLVDEAERNYPFLLLRRFPLCLESPIDLDSQLIDRRAQEAAIRSLRHFSPHSPGHNLIRCSRCYLILYCSCMIYFPCLFVNTILLILSYLSKLHTRPLRSAHPQTNIRHWMSGREAIPNMYYTIGSFHINDLGIYAYCTETQNTTYLHRVIGHYNIGCCFLAYKVTSDSSERQTQVLECKV